MNKFDKFIKEMGLNQCRYCEHFSVYSEGYYLNVCGGDGESNDEFSNCNKFKLSSELADVVEFYYNYK